ncbi:MAG: uracil phosphoribosyltransferase [Rikenellaceae bacterium]|nr:uracil phosphoribosyltransferase [Rikenellaceae bacterium]
MVRVLGKENTLLNKFVSELRDVHIQRDSMRFRKNLERVGEIMAYEISKTLRYKPLTVETPLGEAELNVPESEVILAPILRAGLPMHTGFLNFFDDSENAFVSAYRHYRKDGTFHIDIDSVTTPSLLGKTLVIIDPMLATGASMEIAYQALVQMGGETEFTHIASVIASEDGVEYLKKRFSPDKMKIWTTAVDEELTVKSYIVPGIGDTGDLAYGSKI